MQERYLHINSKERLQAVNYKKEVDRIPFMPTIFEHNARIINKTPSEVALQVNLLAGSHIKAYGLYGHDAVTVGIDVYNIEAEGRCRIVYKQSKKYDLFLQIKDSAQFELGRAGSSLAGLFFLSSPYK